MEEDLVTHQLQLKELVQAEEDAPLRDWGQVMDQLLKTELDQQSLQKVMLEMDQRSQAVVQQIMQPDEVHQQMAQILQVAEYRKVLNVETIKNEVHK